MGAYNQRTKKPLPGNGETRLTLLFSLASGKCVVTMLPLQTVSEGLEVPNHEPLLAAVTKEYKTPSEGSGWLEHAQTLTAMAQVKINFCQSSEPFI